MYESNNINSMQFAYRSDFLEYSVSKTIYFYLAE